MTLSSFIYLRILIEAPILCCNFLQHFSLESFIFLSSSQRSAPHGRDPGRASEENPFQHPDTDLSEQEHNNGDFLADLLCSLDVKTKNKKHAGVQQFVEIRLGPPL